MIYGFMVAALVIGLGAPEARAELPEGYRELRETKATEVDLDGDGKRKVTRRYDERGRLIEQTLRDATVNPPKTESLKISRSPEVWVRTNLRGDAVVRKEEERYSAPGVLAEREVWWSSRDDSTLDRRTLMRYVDITVAITEFAYEAGQWKKLEERTEEAIDSGAKDGAEEIFDAYVECLAKGGPLVDEAACREYLRELPLHPDRLQELGADELARLECRDKGVLHLPTGFRIDLKSCTNKKQVASIKAGAKTMMGGPMACLNELNPKFAAKLALTVDSVRPRIRCAGAKPPKIDIKNEFCGAEPEKKSDEKARELALRRYQSCVEKSERFTLSKAAFVLGRRPHDLFLVSSDPIRRDRAGDHLENGTNPRLAGVLFHEALHQTGHGGSKLHNEMLPDYADEIYGCQALCTPHGSFITKEGCEKCLTTEGNDEALLTKRYKDCKRFPQAEVLRHIRLAGSLRMNIQRCEEDRAAKKEDSKSCALVRASVAYQELCEKVDPKPSEAKCKQLLLASAGEQFSKAVNSNGISVAVDFIIGQGMPTITIQPNGFKVDAKVESPYSVPEMISGQLTEFFCLEVNANEHLTYPELEALRDDYEKRHPAAKSAPRRRLLGNAPLFKGSKRGTDPAQDLKAVVSYCKGYPEAWNDAVEGRGKFKRMLRHWLAPSRLD